MKSFCFFFSKKEALPSYLPSRANNPSPITASPRSTAAIVAINRSAIGVATPCRRAAATTGASCAPASVARLRTARSRHIPLRAFALPRLKSAIAAIEASIPASSPTENATGSNPLNPSGTTPSAAAVSIISRTSAFSSARFAGAAMKSAIVSLVSALAFRIAPYPVLPHKYPQILPVITASGSKSRSIACSPTSRGVEAPCNSPTTTAPRLPNMMAPGAIQSAPKLTNAPIVRSRPITRAITNSFNPF